MNPVYWIAGMIVVLASFWFVVAALFPPFRSYAFQIATYFFTFFGSLFLVSAGVFFLGDRWAGLGRFFQNSMGQEVAWATCVGGGVMLGAGLVVLQMRVVKKLPMGMFRVYVGFVSMVAGGVSAFVGSLIVVSILQGHYLSQRAGNRLGAGIISLFTGWFCWFCVRRAVEFRSARDVSWRDMLPASFELESGETSVSMEQPKEETTKTKSPPPGRRE